MSQPIFSLTYEDLKPAIKFDIHDSDNFSWLENITQVYWVVLNDENHILLISEDEKIRGLPWGTKEQGETHLDTLHRELYEEAAVTVKEDSIMPLYHQKVHKKIDDKRIFDCHQIRYVAKLKEQHQFQDDPGGKVIAQKFVSINELGTYLPRGETTKFIQEKIKNIV